MSFFVCVCVCVCVCVTVCVCEREKERERERGRIYHIQCICMVSKVHVWICMYK